MWCIFLQVKQCIAKLYRAPLSLFYYKSYTKSWSLCNCHFQVLAWGSWKLLQWTAWWKLQHRISALAGTVSFVKHWKPIHQFKWVWQKSIEGFFVWIFPHRHCSCPGSGSAPWRHPRRHHLHHLQWEQIPFLQHQLKYRSDRNFWQDFDKMHTKNNQKDVKQYFLLTMAVSWPTSMHYWCFHRWNLGTELKWPGFWGHSKTPPSGEGWNYILKLLHGCQPDSSGCQRQPPPIPAAELCGLYAWSTGLWFSNPSGKGSSTCLYF